MVSGLDLSTSGVMVNYTGVFEFYSIQGGNPMKQNRQNTYVERELLRRRCEARHHMKEKLVNLLSMIALVLVSEALLFAMILA